MKAAETIDVAAIAEQLREANVEHAERIASLAEWSWQIEPQRVGSELASGQSRFGGSPDVPADFPWPTTGGRPLAFLAQIHLTDVQAAALPADGWLLFFYDVEMQPWGFDPNEAGSWKVVYVEAGRVLSRDAPPPPLVAFEACRLSMERSVALPDLWDAELDRVGAHVAAEDRDGYVAAVCKIAGHPTNPDADERCHHLLGLPQIVQNDMRLECELASNGVYVGDATGYASARGQELRAGAPEWRLLLQIDSHEEGPGWTWGDAGRLYFWIRRADLAAHAFDKVWVVLQCG